ncbi:MAG: AIR synthase related protein [Bacteroidota bacterium]
MFRYCNSRYVYADPEKGAAIAVSESARNVVCSGGEPVAITNCLNFGNPYVPEVYWHFVSAIKGMKTACEALKTPVTGGNVSFYNQSSDEGPVFPTPTIGMLGLMEGLENRMTLDFKNEGDLIFLVGEPKNDISSSEYLYSFHHTKESPTPHFEMETEVKLQQDILALIRAGVLQSAHDLSDGGLWISLFESAHAGTKGFSVKQSHQEIRKDAFWFGEAQSRAMVSVAPSQKEAFLSLATERDISVAELGTVNNTGNFTIDGESWGTLSELNKLYSNSLEEHLEG